MNWKPGDLAIIDTERRHDVAGVHGEHCRLKEFIGDTSGYADDGNHYRMIRAWIVCI